MAANNLGAWSSVNPFPSSNHGVNEYELQNGSAVQPTTAEIAGGDLEGDTPDGNSNDEAELGEQAVDPIRPSNDPALPLNSRDVCAFIVNKMIGTGIFTTPPTVLLLTRSKGEAIGLWILGFVYTLTRFVL